MKKVRTDKAMPATSLDNRFNIDLLLAKEELTEAHDSMSTKMKAPTKIAKPHISKHAKLPIESKEHSGLTSGNSSSTGDKVATKSSGKSSVVQMTSQLKAELACQGKSTIRSHTDLSSGDDEDYVYGDNAEGGSALLSSGKDKNKRKAPRKPTKDEVALAQKLSKGQKRRLESIEKRKATEAKTADYLQVIAQHAISEEQRSLLVSGKQVGQTSSVKQMLSHLLKRHRAGLDLTPQERELLFPNGGALAEEAGEAFAHAEAETEEISVADTSMLLNTQGESTLLSLKSLTQSTPPSLSGAREMEREKEKEKAKARRKKTKSAGAADEEKHAEVQENGDKKDGDEFVSFGANLMAQLSALKASGRLPAAKSKEMLLAVTAAVDTGDDDAVAPLLVQVPASTGLAQVVPKEVIEYKTLTQTLRGEAPVAMYKATPLTLPMLDGKDADRILAYAHASSTSTAPSSSGPITAPKSKLVSGQRISVRRRDDIQQARMQLPVCAMEQEIVEAIIEDTSHLVGRGAGAEFISAYEGVPLSNKRAVVGSNGTDVVILCGETGSGKSTQVPQFLHEYGLTRHGMIGITQPRRVAATSTAERVAVELGEPITANGLGKKKAGLVGYQIRHDVSTVSDQTRIKFMTDGILIQEIMSDFLLRKYSVIILDEAHERNINTDMLLGLLSRCLPVRRAQAVVENEVWNRLPAVEKELYALPIRPLKLIIMSATLRVGDFVTPRLFPSPPPVLKVEARQYQVTTHFSKKTELDHYLKAAHKKVCQIHRKLPAGGILIFLTGKREIMHFVEKLQKSLGSRSKKRTVPRERGGAVSAHAENENEALEGTDANFHHSDFGGLDVDEACGEAEGDDLDSIGSISDSDSEADSDFQYDEEDAQQKTVAASGAGAAAPVAAKVLTEEEKTRARMLRRALGQSEDEPEAFVQGQIGQTDVDSKASNAHDVDVGELQPQAVFVLPLFAMMTAEQQAKVFREPPAGSRLIVVATNVAETSITIPNIRYVVDSGRQKVKTRNISSGVSKFEVAWISQAQAEQRKGRAGRTGPGHVYRLYSANFFDQHMPQFGVPEIMSIPLEGLLLQMKSIGVTDLASFPFPTQPPAQSLTTAVNTLLYLGAIERVPSNIGNIPAHMRWLLASKEQATVEENITPLGMLLAKIPIYPRLGKILVFAHQNGDQSLFNHALSLVAVLTESTPFNRMQSSTHANSSGDESDLDSEEEAERDARKKASKEASLWWHVHGDALARLRAIGAYSFSLSRAIAAGVDAVQHVLNKEAAWRRHIEQVSEDAPVKKKSKGQRQQQKPEQVQSMDENGETKRIENEFVFSSQVTRRSIYSQIVAAGVKEFVSKHAVAAVTLDRALELRTQLLEKCVQVLGPLVKTDNEKGHGPPGLYSNAKQQQVHASARSVAALSPPTSAEESALRQLLAASFCDNIARKIPAGMIQKGSRRTRLTAYVSANPAMPGTMYIHPQSALYSPDPTTLLPEFIVYDNLVRNERGDQVYMSVVSAVKSSWLVSVLGPASDNKGQPLCPACPLLKLSAPLASPSPFYDRSADEIVCYVVPTYGNHKWELAPQKRPMYACFSNQIREKCTAKTPIGFFKEEETYRWFARLLLEGRVSFSDTGSTIDSAVSKNLFNVSQCREPPTAITDMRPVPRVTNLLRVLANDGVRNKRLLLEKIRYARENKECYLSEELLAFMHVEHRKEFKKKWIILCESI